MKKTSLAFVLTLIFFASPVQAAYFSDVGIEKEAIYNVADRGIANGNMYSQFEPNRNVTRAEAAKFVARTVGLDCLEYENSEPPFTDTVQAYGLKMYISCLNAKGIASGYGNGKFGSQDAVRQAEFLKMLYRAAGIAVDLNAPSSYQDLTDPTLTPYADIAVLQQVIQVTEQIPGQRLVGNGSLQRWQVAKIIYNFINYLEAYQPTGTYEIPVVNSDTRVSYAPDKSAAAILGCPKDESAGQADYGIVLIDYAAAQKLTGELNACEVGEEVHAQHILIAHVDSSVNYAGMTRSKEEALHLAADLKKRAQSENFEDLAKQYSDDAANKDKGGDLGYFAQGYMVPTFEAAAFSAAIGEIVGPVETDFGYHLIKILDKREQAIKSFTKQELIGPYQGELLQQSVIRLIGWSDDSKYVWGYLDSLRMRVELIFKVDIASGEVETFEVSALNFIPLEFALNPNTAKLAYSDYPSKAFVDNSRLQELADKQTVITLYVYDLLSEQKQTVASATAIQFDPIWSSTNTLEYNNPSGIGRIAVHP